VPPTSGVCFTDARGGVGRGPGCRRAVCDSDTGANLFSTCTAEQKVSKSVLECSGLFAHRFYRSRAVLVSPEEPPGRPEGVTRA